MKNETIQQLADLLADRLSEKLVDDGRLAVQLASKLEQPLKEAVGKVADKAVREEAAKVLAGIGDEDVKPSPVPGGG